ncbi:MAG TPA: hypothetical protein VKT81_10975 [Bryobacteraceae bacterium]|nr:hypothetical protein [Bryobacteraceae bacterium]
MKARRAAWLWLGLAIPVSAHRLDEYLQATRLAIGAGQVDVEMDLTPGVAVASQVFAWIDTNRDGRISRAEGETYARAVLQSAALKADETTAPLTLEESAFPSFEEMREGVGVIRLRARAAIPAAYSGRHRISFLNLHRPELSVYLVNALVPENRRIEIREQRRDIAQHGITLDYTVTGVDPPQRTQAVFLGLGMAGILALRLGISRRACARAAIRPGPKVVD